MILHNFRTNIALIFICSMVEWCLSQSPSSGHSSNNSLPVDTFLDEEAFEKDYPYIVSLKYHLREDMLPKLFTEIALQNIPCAVANCVITLPDIADAARLYTYSTNALAEAIEKLNIPSERVYSLPKFYNITADSIEDLLLRLGLTFSDCYSRFVDSLTNPIDSIPKILDAVKVDRTEFMTAQIYGNDSRKLQVLTAGNYSQTNVEEVLKITNKTYLDLLKLLPLNVASGNLKRVNLTNFVEVLGITSDDLLRIYQFLNVTPINFLSSPIFIQAVTDYYDFLNPEEVIGTFISKFDLVTSNAAEVLAIFNNQETDLIKYYAVFHGELLENPLVQYLIKRVSLSNPEFKSRDIAKIGILEPTLTPAQVSYEVNKTSLVNCTYIARLPFGGLHSETANSSRIILLNNTAVTVQKSNITLYNLGGPLICQDKLIAIAVKDDVNVITFSTLAKTQFVTPILPGTSGGGSGSSSGTTGKPSSAPVFNKSNLIFTPLLIILVLNGLIY